MSVPDQDHRQPEWVRDRPQPGDIIYLAKVPDNAVFSLNLNSAGDEQAGTMYRKGFGFRHEKMAFEVTPVKEEKTGKILWEDVCIPGTYYKKAAFLGDDSTSATMVKIEALSDFSLRR